MILLHTLSKNHRFQLMYHSKVDMSMCMLKEQFLAVFWKHVTCFRSGLDRLGGFLVAFWKHLEVPRSRLEPSYKYLQLCKTIDFAMYIHLETCLRSMLVYNSSEKPV